MVGSATFTIEMSSTTMNWIAQSRIRANQRRSEACEFIGVESPHVDYDTVQLCIKTVALVQTAGANMSTDQQRRPPGRPRSEEADREIIAATLRLLAEQGYER